MTDKQIVPVEVVGQKIFIIRGVKVMLDSDLAELYRVPTKSLNLAVKRNSNRFPVDFMFQLNKQEVENLRFQFETSSLDKPANLISQIATSSWGGRRNLPYAFTEHGVAMLSAVLKSERAVEMSVFIVRAFVRLREILASNKELAHKIGEIERDQKNQNKHISAIYRILDKLVTETVKPKDKIGFRVEPTH